MSLADTQRAQIMNDLINTLGENNGVLETKAFAAAHGITQQSVYRYIARLESEHLIVKELTGKKQRIHFVDESLQFTLETGKFDEDYVWRRQIHPFLSDIPRIPYENLLYACTEMLNNANEHSEGTAVTVQVIKNIYCVKVIISDDGIGIFTKISRAMNLPEKSFAILELAKGKFTTDPNSHTGEGIFFSSKIVDRFMIESDGLFFYGDSSHESQLLDTSANDSPGTTVFMEIKLSHQERSSDVFNRFIDDPDTYGFNKTIVPVRLLEYGDATPMVVSRSQAKRLMVRFERFTNIILDFTGVEEIGQGFADELFRVFQTQHPGTVLTPINCSSQIQKMISRVQHTL